MSTDDQVVFVVRPESPGIPVTTRDIGVELGAGYPHQVAEIFRVFADEVRGHPTWLDEVDAIAKEMPQDWREEVASVLEALCCRLRAAAKAAREKALCCRLKAVAKAAREKL